VNLNQFIQTVKLAYPNISLSDSQYQSLYWLTQECLRWSAVHNLTSFKTIDRFVDGHIIDSLSLCDSLKRISKQNTMLDFGTGAGFPGLVIAILKPDLTICLLDNNYKKIAFVNHARAQLKLNNVTTVCKNIQDYKGEAFDIITARAVSSISEIIDNSKHLLKDDGTFWLLKGPNWQQEQWAGQPQDVITLRNDPKRFLLVMTKVSTG
tara:strand:+ start:312 stop:935 length:624 start_codon:yes stop_codon:yes gene_type:complete